MSGRLRQSRCAAAKNPVASIALAASARPSSGSGSGWRSGRPRRGRERVARQEAGEDGARSDHDGRACRPPRQPDDESREHDCRGREPEPRPGAFGEVFGRECGVDAGADRAGKDDNVAFELGEVHLTITSPSMSCSCRVQT